MSASFMQCVGRALRGKTDYGIMIFADKVQIVRINGSDLSISALCSF